MKKVSIFFLVLITTGFSFSQNNWKVKNESAEIKFKIKNFGVWVEGSLGNLNAVINFDANNPEKGEINASVDVNTINTGISSRDNHLKKEEYFDAEKHPKITIKSSSILKEKDQFLLKGKLTIKGITKDISFPFVFGEVEGKAVFRAEFEINRIDFSVGTGGGPMGEKVKITLSVPVVRQ